MSPKGPHKRDAFVIGKPLAQPAIVCLYCQRQGLRWGTPH